MLRRVWVVVLVVANWLGGAAVAQPYKPPPNVLARAGEMFVTEKEFLQPVNIG
jgi:hypothetical protein